MIYIFFNKQIRMCYYIISVNIKIFYYKIANYKKIMSCQILILLLLFSKYTINSAKNLIIEKK